MSRWSRSKLLTEIDIPAVRPPGQSRTLATSQKAKNRWTEVASFDLLIVTVICILLGVPYLNFLASTISEMWRVSQNFKSRSRDRF